MICKAILLPLLVFCKIGWYTILISLFVKTRSFSEKENNNYRIIFRLQLLSSLNIFVQQPNTLSALAFKQIFILKKTRKMETVLFVTNMTIKQAIVLKKIQPLTFLFINKSIRSTLSTLYQGMCTKKGLKVKK